MRVSDRLRQAGSVSWHIPAEAQESVRNAYLRLHRLKHELDQMEEIPPHLQPLYTKVGLLAEKCGDLVQESEQVVQLARRLAQKYR